MSLGTSRRVPAHRSDLLFGGVLAIALALLMLAISQAAVTLSIPNGNPLAVDQFVAIVAGITYLLLVAWLARSGRVRLASTLLIAAAPLVLTALWARWGIAGPDQLLIVSYSGPLLAAIGALLGFVLGWRSRFRRPSAE